MNELVTGFTRLSDRKVADLAARIHLALTTPPGDGYFPELEPQLAVLQSAIAALQAALALETSTSAAALRKSCRDEVAGLLSRLAANLELSAKGDYARLAASGFDLRKKPGGRTATPMPVPTNLRMKHTGISGQAMGKVTAIPGADNYQGQHALNPEGPWTDIDPVSSSQRLLFTSLARGVDRYFRVRANGPNGPGGWSDIATLMII